MKLDIIAALIENAIATAETLVIKLVNNNVSTNDNTIPAEASGGMAICSMKY